MSIIEDYMKNIINRCEKNIPLNKKLLKIENNEIVF